MYGIDGSAGQIASAYSSYQTTKASLGISGSYLDVTGGVNGSYFGDVEDRVDVSGLARELIDRVRELDVFSVIYPDNDARKETKTLAEVESDFFSDFTKFADIYGKFSSLMGLEGTYTIGLDGVGGVTVSGDDAMSASRLQAGINRNSTAVSRFAVMAARASLADAGYTVDGFQSAYAEDPVQAIKDNIDALKERLLGFRTVSGDGNMQYGFIRDMDLEIEYESVTAAYGSGWTGAV